MKKSTLLLFLPLHYERQLVKFNNKKKHLINKISNNLIILHSIQNKSNLVNSEVFNNRQIIQSNLNNHHFACFYLKIKKIHFISIHTLKKYYYISFYLLSKNKYFLTDIKFKTFWTLNLLSHFISFYRFYFFTLITTKLLLLSNFNIRVFNRFKKIRRRFITYFTYNKSTSFLSLPLKTNQTTKVMSFIYSYWNYFKVFLFTKKVLKQSIHKIIRFPLFISATLSFDLLDVSLRPFFIYHSMCFLGQPLFYNNLFINLTSDKKLFKVKSLLSRRRKFKRFIFKKYKQSNLFFNELRFCKIKKHIFSFIYSFFFRVINIYLFFSYFTPNNVSLITHTSKSLKLHKFRFRSARKFSRKKKRNLRRRFFFTKRLKRHSMHRYFKQFRFKKTLFRNKLLIAAKAPFLTNFNKVMMFNKNFLLNTSTKSILILTLLFLNKFRRVIPHIIFLYKNFYNSTQTIHFKRILNSFKKWSNVIPFFYLPSSVKLLVKSKKTKLTHYDYLLYLRQIIGGFLESITQKKIFLKITTKLRIRKKIKKALFFLYKRHRNYQNSIGRGFFFNEMLFVCWYSLFTKDLQFLLGWLTRAMCRMEIRKHRKFIKILKVLFTKYKYFFLRTNRVKGIKLDIRGKLGVKGNAKKRHLSFNVNTTSFSKKKYRLDYRQGLVYTETGVLGVTLILTY